MCFLLSQVSFMFKLFVIFSFVGLLFFSATTWANSGTPSPFEIGQMVGNNLGRASAQAREENAVMRRERERVAREAHDLETIRSILRYANQSNNLLEIQQAICDVITRVSPERQSQVIAYLQNRYNTIKESQ